MSSIVKDLDAFNFVAMNLIEQNDKSMNENDECQYRGYPQSVLQSIVVRCSSNEEIDYDELTNLLANEPIDAKCAVGHLISDAIYSYDLEGKLVDEEILDIVQQSHPEWKMTEQSKKMLMRLQKIHDAMTVELWPEAFSLMQKDFDTNGDYTGGYTTTVDIYS